MSHEWQKIETAPKDASGIELDPWVKDDDNPDLQYRQTDCMYVNGAWCINEHCHEWEPLSVFNLTPTHWMLPPPPPQ